MTTSRALLAAVLAAALLGACGGEPEAQDAPQGATQEQACAQAEEVTDTYQDALGDAASAEDAKGVIDGAIQGLRDIETSAPVGGRIDELATAMSGLLESVEAGTPPQQLQSQAQAVGAAATALARDCGRVGQ